MSNHLAIATVSTALGNVVASAAQAAVSGTLLRFGRPVAPAQNGEKRVHVYLFQVTPNGALRNTDVPSRDASSHLTGRPRAALDLHYLVTFYGDDEQLEPARMAGAVARELHTNPTLSKQALLDASVDALADSDLASAVERVRFTPAPLSLDEFSKLWSLMTQTPHALSLVYQASVVLIDARQGAGAAPPVLRRGPDDQLEADTAVRPRLEALWIGNVELAERRPLGPSQPTAALGARLLVRGVNLGAAPSFELGRATLPPLVIAGIPTKAASTWIVDLPTDSPADTHFASGLYQLRALVSTGGKQISSNLLPLGLRPSCAIDPPGPVARDGDGTARLSLRFHPQVRQGQGVTLLVAGSESTVEASETTDRLTFDVHDSPVVTDELVRVRVDGVESLPLVYDEKAGGLVFDDSQRITIT